jgi:hypothetical protein
LQRLGSSIGPNQGLRRVEDRGYTYNLWRFNIAMENDPFIDGLPIKNGDFP